VILLIAGVNLSNLLLARAVARAKEFAVRGALGATRGRIVRQLLMESLVLSSAGAVLGLGLAATLIAWLAHQGAVALPLLTSLSIDGQAVAWTILIAVFTATIFGLIPGLRIASGNLQEMLKDSGPGAGQGRKHERVRAALVILEVALACVLLVSAGLLLRSFVKVLDVDLGFQPDRAASIKVDYDDSAKTEEASQVKRGAIFQQIIARVSALPGVEAAGMSDYLPLGPNREWDEPTPKGKTFAPGELPAPLVYVITPGFVRALGIHLHGRDFTWADGPHSERVVLIKRLRRSRVLARRRRSRQNSNARQRGRPRCRSGRRRPRRNGGRRHRLTNLLPSDAAGTIRCATGDPYQSAAGDAGRDRSQRAARTESQTTGRRIPAHPDDRGPRRLPAPLLHAAGRRVSPVSGYCWPL